VTLVDIEVPADTTRRDRYGRYLVQKQDDPTKLVGLQRATSLAKNVDETFSLEGHWKSTTLVGAHLNPALAALAHAAHEAGDKRAAKQHAENAFELAGGNVKRNRGTLIHDYTDRKLRDPDWQIPELYRAQVEAIVASIPAHGFRVVTEFSEMIVVLYRCAVAGRMDFALHHEATDTYYVGDLKTGSVAFSGVSWSIQLAIYANADCGYIQGDADDGSEDHKIPLPAFDRERAIIINSPLDTTAVHWYWLDIAKGADLLPVVTAVREARKLKSKVLTKFEGGGTDTPAASLGTANAPAATVVAGPVDQTPTNAAAPVTSPADDVSPLAGDIHHQADVAWLINRTTALVTATSKQHVAQVWPVDIARPGDIKAGTATWDAGDIDVIAIALDALEAKHDLPFGDPRPSIAADLAARFDAAVTADRTPPPKLTPAPDDDGPAPDHYVTELKRLAGEMQQAPDADVRARIARAQLWQRDANTADVPWRTGLGPNGSTPMRVWAIGRAAIACTSLVDLTADDPDHKVRVLLETYCGDHAYTQRVGPLFGSLSTDQAIAVWDMADEITNTPTATAKDNQQ
jgi:hypothetical protein